MPKTMTEKAPRMAAPAGDTAQLLTEIRDGQREIIALLQKTEARQLHVERLKIATYILRGVAYVAVFFFLCAAVYVYYHTLVQSIAPVS